MTRRLRGFATATDGATAVEFAMVSPLILLAILFLMSIGYIFIMNQALDAATQKAARLVRTGFVQGVAPLGGGAGVVLTQTQFRTQVVCPLLPSLFNCNNVIVNMMPVNYGTNHPNEYYAFAASDLSGLTIPPLDNTQTQFCPGQAQGYVYLQILYPVNLFMSMLATSAVATTYKGGKYYLIMATATFLNEPFVAPAASC